MKEKIVIVRCDYQEFNPVSYAGMVVKWPDDERILFWALSKSPEKDLEDCDKWAMENGFLPFHSSTVDNFFLDQENGVFVI